MNQSKLSLTSKFSVLIAAVISLAMLLSGCNYLKGMMGSGTPGAKTGGTQKPASQGGGQPLDGYWKLAFSLNENVQSCHIRITQNGNKFSGEGTDDHNSKPFLIENGGIKDGEVVFYKRYEHPDNPNQPPVEYSGTFDPKAKYMGGHFVLAYQGQEVTGDWEAQIEPEDGAAPALEAEQQAPAPAEQPKQSTNSDKAPDLSGKWTTGYEFNFKTMHSSMFLEQDRGTITGHGIDENTNEKFTIEKGWYAFPKVTLIRKYAPLKTKTGTKPERRMTFKADVSWVSDKDYTGPYMSGKTDGGGNWEAQLVR